MICWKKREDKQQVAKVLITQNLRYTLHASGRRASIVEHAGVKAIIINIRRSGMRQSKQWCEQMLRKLTLEQGISLNL